MVRCFESPPIIVGGVGGSGTRVVAEMLETMGVFIGYDLNSANDNMRLGHFIPLIIEKLRAAAPGSTILDDYPLRYGDDIANFIYSALQGLERDMRVAYLAQQSLRAGWGWKVPGIFHLLQPLSSYFGSVKYVHVMRHGVDMAFSANQNQVRNWGWRFGVDVEGQPLHVASFQYWVRANKQAIIDAKRAGIDLHLLNFDDLCRNPAREVEALLSYLGVCFTAPEKLTTLVQIPGSMGRRHNFDQSFITQHDRKSLMQLGFDAD